MSDTRQHDDQRTVAYATPELQLSALIQVNTDLAFATVTVRGSLTLSNCAALIRIVARTSYVASDLTISVDLSDAKSVDQEALSRLENYPSWMVIGPSPRLTAAHGEAAADVGRPVQNAGWIASAAALPERSMKAPTSAIDSLSVEDTRGEQGQTAVRSRLAPEEPFPADLTVLDQTTVEVLNSRTHRQLDTEYIRDRQSDPETDARLAELTEELDRTDAEAGQR